jgi:hypothetical protein
MRRSEPSLTVRPAIGQKADCTLPLFPLKLRTVVHFRISAPLLSVRRHSVS